MTWVLVVAGFLALVAAVFGWALCVMAARADRMVERQLRRQAVQKPRFTVVKTETKRPRASDVAEGMTEER